MIGCTQMCELWVAPEKVADAVKFIIEIYGPLIPQQNYCFTLHSDPEREQ
jgi:hypothetical protein